MHTTLSRTLTHQLGLKGFIILRWNASGLILGIITSVDYTKSKRKSIVKTSTRWLK